MAGSNVSLADVKCCMQVGAGAGTYCMSGIVGNGPEGKVVMGASFLRAYYSVYTYDLVSGNAWVSLAPSAIDTGLDSEAVEITNAAAAAGAPLSAGSVFVTPRMCAPCAQPPRLCPDVEACPQAASMHARRRASGRPGLERGALV